jgi:hypothetical protein
MPDKDFIAQKGLITGINTTSIGTAFTITSAGNIGVGNSTPSEKLVINGSANVTGTVNSSGLSVGSNFIANSVGISVVSSFISNTTGVYHTGLVNASSYNIGSSFTANSTLVNAASYSIGSNFIANTTGAYHTGLVNASSYNIGSSFTANSTLVNAISFYVGSTLIGNSTGPYGKAESSLSVNNALNLAGSAASNYRLKSEGKVLPANTRVTFQQTTAPTGFTKVTTFNDYAMRIVSGSVVNKTDGVAFTTAFASQSVSGTVGSTTATNISATQTGTIGSTSLTSDQLPAHSHSVNISDPGHSHGNPITSPGGVDRHFPAGSIMGSSAGVGGYGNFTDTRGTGISISVSGGGSGSGHNHSFTGDAHNHNQNSHNHTFTGTSINMAVNYVDFILATADA